MTPAATSQRAPMAALGGLFLTLVLAALDQNIVATALPRIAADLDGLAHLSWVVTAFMLASTAGAPLYGKLSDLYGRRPLFFAAILIFVLGSVLCGVARGMTGLIIFRGVQGLGAGGLIALAQIAIADLVPSRERAHYHGLGAGVYVLCSVAGPLIGGFLTDALSWRWIFYVNLPVGIGAFVLIVLGLPRTNRVVRHQIDFAGAALLIGGTACLLLVLSWGGALYPWLSPPVISFEVATLLLFVLLVFQERRAPEPVLPMRLFADRVFAVGATVTGLTATALFGSVVFLPAYFQIVLGESPTVSGLMSSPLMIGVILASAAGGKVVGATGRYKILPILGLAGAVLALLAIAGAVAAELPGRVIAAELVVLGGGLGLVLPNLIVAIQNAVARQDLGAATAAVSYFRSLGGALGVAATGAVTSAYLVLPGTGGAGVARAVGEPSGQAVLGPGLQQIGALSAAARAAFVVAYRQGVLTAALAGAAVALLALLIALTLPERPMSGAGRAEVPEVGE